MNALTLYGRKKQIWKAKYQKKKLKVRNERKTVFAAFNVYVRDLSRNNHCSGGTCPSCRRLLVSNPKYSVK